MSILNRLNQLSLPGAIVIAAAILALAWISTKNDLVALAVGVLAIAIVWKLLVN